MGSSNRKTACVELSDRARKVCYSQHIKGDFWIGLSFGVSLQVMHDHGLDSEFLVLLRRIAHEAKEELGQAYLDSLNNGDLDAVFTRED